MFTNESRGFDMKETYEWIHSWCDEAGKRDLPRVLLVGDSITHSYQNEVRELLKDFYGDTKIQIREAGTDETHECRNYCHAILEYGHYEISNWHVEGNVLDILVQSI